MFICESERVSIRTYNININQGIEQYSGKGNNGHKLQLKKKRADRRQYRTGESLSHSESYFGVSHAMTVIDASHILHKNV